MVQGANTGHQSDSPTVSDGGWCPKSESKAPHHRARRVGQPTHWGLDDLRPAGSLQQRGLGLRDRVLGRGQLVGEVNPLVQIDAAACVEPQS